MALPLCTLLTSAGLFLVAVALATGGHLRWPSNSAAARTAPGALLALLSAAGINAFSVLQRPEEVSITGWVRLGLCVVATALLTLALTLAVPRRGERRWLDRIPPFGRWGILSLSAVVCIDSWEWLWPGLLSIASVAGSALAAVVLVGAVAIGVGALLRRRTIPLPLDPMQRLPMRYAADAQGVVMNNVVPIPRPPSQPVDAIPRIPKRWKIGLAIVGALILLTRPTFLRAPATPAATTPWDRASATSSELADLQQQRSALLARLAAVDRAIAGNAPAVDAPIGTSGSGKSPDAILSAVEAAWATRSGAAPSRAVETVDLSQYGTRTDVRSSRPPP